VKRASSKPAAKQAVKRAAKRVAKVPHIVTPSQTVGPFFAVGFGAIPPLSSADIPGERVTVTGRLLDGAGAPIPDGMLEIWQANPRGKYAHPEDWQDKQITPGFTGYGRMLTDKEGTFRFETLRPGAVPWPGTDSRAGERNGVQAPHIVVAVFSRGLLKHLFTRIYFGDDPQVAADPVLALVKDPARRQTLVAKPEQSGHYRWDIVLQGPGETVFFDV
jgi:protocatechuate 3,4-dioxygenase, alpha subunit